MISKLVKFKEKAFQNGSQSIIELQTELTNFIDQNTEQKIAKDMKEKYLGLNPIDITDFIYNNNKFYEYLKYSFIAKSYEQKLNNIKLLIILVAIIIGIIIYNIFKMGIIFIIFVIAIVLILIFIFNSLKTGETYTSYYNRTMLNFIINIYNELNFKIDSIKILNDDTINQIIDSVYDKKTISNNISFGNDKTSGNILDMKLTRIIKSKDKNGNVNKKEVEVFDGIYLKIDIKTNNNRLKGNTIKIRADENLLSSMTEDTVKGIYESELDFSFNSEEMNKSFDCKISGYNGFNNADEMLIETHKVLTPSFEQHLLYLRERYNTFNMNITDNGLIATFNMERSVFQQAKHNELLDFRVTYREANEKFKVLKADIYGIEDFAYYNVFPFIERMFLIKYLTYLYLSYIDFDNYYDINNGTINDFEEKMNNIYKMNNKEFKEIYLDKLQEIKKQTKDSVKEFEEKEKK